MTASRSTFVLTLLFGTCCGCERIPLSASASTTKSWPLDKVQTSPADITFQSATAFRLGGVPCKLLGVKEADDPAVRKQALDFAKAWLKSIGNYAGPVNYRNPLMDPDGTAIVCLIGADMYGSRLGAELVRAGLATVDESSWTDYTFIVLGKNGDHEYDWRRELREAKEGHERGEKPRVLFDWPPKQAP